MTTHYDVAIIGSGPAGALAAYYLGRSGANCVIIEKEKFPRYKPCGGGITLRALNCLPFSIDCIVEDKTIRPIILLKSKPLYEKKFSKPIIHMVMRDRFDRFLAEKATEQGVDILEGCRFKAVSGAPGQLTISTSTGPIYSKFVVGADGATGLTARALDFPRTRKHIFALESELPLDEKRIEAFRGKALFDLSVIPNGYGWVFPKADHLSVGLGTDARDIKHLKPYLAEYFRSNGLDSDIGLKSARPHLIPYSPGRRSILADRRGLLIGDASGFADPVTGEGLYSAFRQASIGADLIIEALEFGADRLLQFDRLNHQRIGTGFQVRTCFQSDTLPLSTP